MDENIGTFVDSKFEASTVRKSSKSKKRILVKTTRLNTIKSQKGIILANLGKNFLVNNYQDFKKWYYNPVECVRGGTIVTEHNDSTILTVGDIVDYSLETVDSDSDIIGKIVRVYPRKSFISRKSIRGNSEDVLGSNVNNLLIFMSIQQPHYNKRLIDRILVASEIGNVKPALCINKIDLDSSLEFLDDLKVYRKLKIKIFAISALNNIGLDELRKYFRNKITAVIGPSGAGKSTMLNAILGEEVQKVGELRHKHTKGKHTTSHLEMFFMKEGGAIIDTPGIREFGIYGITKDNLCFYFHEFNKYYEECRFMPCTHTHEPDCKVKEAVQSGLIDEDRYISYLNIYDSID